MTSWPYAAAAFEPGVSRAGYSPRRIVPPLSSMSRWSGIKSMTGFVVNMSNSVELASSVPEHVARDLDHRALQAEAQAEVRDPWSRA